MGRKKKTGASRKQILAFARDRYGTEPEYPWRGAPHAVLRHGHNRKWYGLLMEVPRNRLGLSGTEPVQVLNLKCDPLLIGALLSQEGFLPAYHMNRSNWISILLDGPVQWEEVRPLLEMSYDLTAGRRAAGGGYKEWIVPANPKYYDVDAAFAAEDTIVWKQSSRVSPGDMVYLYVAAPYSAIRYQCRAVEVNLPYPGGKNGETLHIRRVMRIQRLRTFDRVPLDREKLKEHGVYTVRGPRYMPESLRREIDLIYGAL